MGVGCRSAEKEPAPEHPGSLFDELAAAEREIADGAPGRDFWEVACRLREQVQGRTE